MKTLNEFDATKFLLVSNSDTSTVIVNLFFAGSPLESFNITETFSFKLKLIFNFLSESSFEKTLILF